MDGYRAGSLKHHPDWAANGTVAVRSTFDDTDDTGCSSWLVVSPGSGALYRTEAFVAEWPDVPDFTLTVEATATP